MADTIWTNGNADRDHNNAANFSGTVPQGTGTLFYLPDFSAADSGPNVNMAAHTAVDQDGIFVGEGYTQDIGASGNDMQISADRVWHEGSGKMWFKDGDGTTDQVIVRSTAPDPTKSVMNITGATVTKLDVLRGGVEIDGSGTVTNIVVGQITSNASDANLTIASSATISTLLEQYGGNTGCNAAIPTVRMMGGILTQATATITTLYVFGGTVNFNFAGTITDVFHFGGMIDVTLSGGRKTFTNYYWYPGAVLKSTPDLLTVTNEFPAVLGAFA